MGDGSVADMLWARPSATVLGIDVPHVIGSSAAIQASAAARAMEEAYGRELTTEGQGGSIPLCNVFAETYPDAEIMLLGVEEPKCLIHAPNESVDPSEIEHIALAEALFLRAYAAEPGRR